MSGATSETATYEAQYENYGNTKLACTGLTGNTDCVLWGNTTLGTQSITDTIDFSSGDSLLITLYNAEDWDITTEISFNLSTGQPQRRCLLHCPFLPAAWAYSVSSGRAGSAKRPLPSPDQLPSNLNKAPRNCLGVFVYEDSQIWNTCFIIEELMLYSILGNQMEMEPSFTDRMVMWIPRVEQR